MATIKLARCAAPAALIALLALTILTLGGCDGLLATDDCPGFLHRVDRIVTVDDTRDTIRVGDTVTFSFLLPWVVTTRFSYELQDSFTFDLRDAPNPTGNFVGWHASFAPLGPAEGLTDRILGTPFIEKIVLRGGNEVGYQVGDSTARGLEGEMALVFQRAGRYYLTFIAHRPGRKQYEYDAYNLTRTDGCRERIYIHCVGANYDIDGALVDAHNAASEIQMRVYRPHNDDYANYYVLVTE